MKEVEVEAICPFCGILTKAKVPYDGYIMWDRGRGPLIQQCFPNLDSSIRELFITGMCFSCQNTRFIPEQEESIDENLVDYEDLLSKSEMLSDLENGK